VLLTTYGGWAMDANKCWQDLRDALAVGDRDAAADLAESLRGWIDRGGFWPSAAGRSEVFHTLWTLSGRRWRPEMRATV
jgi:hypothetical protein